MSTSTSKAPTVDPVTVEIIRNGLLAVTEEMKTNLTRTAYNLIIYEALDFTVGLFTTNGDTVSIGLGLPMFIRGMSETVKAKIKRYGLSGIKPGDIIVTNDAYTTGSHLNHFTFTMPVFHRGELIAFTCCMAHWLDVGGTLGQVTTGHLLRRYPNPNSEVPAGRSGQSGTSGHHRDECSPIGTRDGRSSCADYCRHNRRAKVLGTGRALRQGRGAWAQSRKSWTIPKRLRVQTRARSQTEYMKPSHSWTTMVWK